MYILKLRKDKDTEWETLDVIVGPQGPQGIQGEVGPAGKDGYTPVKGVDYFDGETGPVGPAGPKGDTYNLTEDDKAEIAQLVLAAMPAAEEGVY